MRINFFGDLVIPSVSGLILSESVKSIISEGDINLLNFEAPCPSSNHLETPLSKSGPVLKQDVLAPKWVEENGFQAVSLANNHMMDYSDIGFMDTISLFKRTKTFGAGTWQEAYKPLIFETGSKTIAFLALTHCEFGTLTDGWDNRFDKGTAWICHPLVSQIIVETKKKVDYLFLFAHAGVEHIEQPLPEWRNLYRNYIDLGCDGVIASHPHIQQGWEFYNGKPIVYSLGNFYFPKKSNNHNTTWYRSLCASLFIDANDIRLEIIPLKFEWNLVDLDDSNQTKDYLRRVNEVLSDEKQYISYINNTCLTMLPGYTSMLLGGGIDLGLNLKSLKYVIKMLLGRKNNMYHRINCIWCESHRWFITRALKMKHSIR